MVLITVIELSCFMGGTKMGSENQRGTVKNIKIGTLKFELWMKHKSNIFGLPSINEISDICSSIYIGFQLCSQTYHYSAKSCSKYPKIREEIMENIFLFLL